MAYDSVLLVFILFLIRKSMQTFLRCNFGKAMHAVGTVWFAAICVLALTANSASANPNSEPPTSQPSTESDDMEMPFALDEDGRLVQFDQHIAPIFRQYCLQCHNAKEERGGFRIDDRDTVMAYLEPEDASASMLFTDYLTIDDEDMLMPPRTHGGPLSAGELSLIQVWINEGADWPDDYALVSSEDDAKVAAPVAPPKSLVGRVWAAQGFLHPATVHFPIALLLVGAAFVVIGWKWPALGTQIPLACLIIGAVTSVASTAMGFSFAVEQGYGSWNRFDAAMFDKEVFWHRWTGVIVAVLASVLAIIAVVSIRKDDPHSRGTKIWKGGLLVCAALVGLVGHQGGEMTYGTDLYPKMFRTLLGNPGSEEIASPTKNVDVAAKPSANR